MKNTNNITTQIRKGILDFLILLTLKKIAKYPREIIEELNSYGLDLVEGTIYPLFLRLYRNKYVVYEWVESAGHPRKYYSLTQKGIAVLEHYENEWQEINSIFWAIKSAQEEDK